MAGTKEIKNRIKSIESTHQVTKAMEIVATTKYNRLSVVVKQSKPYSDGIKRMLSNIAKGIKGERHPLFDGRDKVETILVIVATGDGGLCGSFNVATLKAYEEFRRHHMDKQITTVTVGKKALEYCRKRDYTIAKCYTGLSDANIIDISREVGEVAVDMYYKHECDEVHVIYNEFVSALTSTLEVSQLIPIERASIEQKSVSDNAPVLDQMYVFEPNAEGVLQVLLPKYLNVCLYQDILNNMASEFSARKNSMKNATESAEDILKTLNIQYNRQRQAAITQEITEIVGGANALN